jgi:hypothetical protein
MFAERYWILIRTLVNSGLFDEKCHGEHAVDAKLAINWNVGDG